MTTPPGIVILLLAAGASSRMRGGDKLLEQVSGRALIAERLAAALRTGAEVIVTLPPRVASPERWQAVAEYGARLIEVHAPGAGMAESLKTGLAALPINATGVLILLADMPEITSADMCALFQEFDGEHILRGTAADGTSGHPVLFPRRDFPILAQLSGDQGAREVLQDQAARVKLIPLPERHALTDLDTPEDWARWRAKQS